MKHLIALALCILLGLNTAEAQIRVTDSFGRQVELNEPAKRIVGLSPHIVENLYAVGAGSAVVGAVAYADYPEAAKALPRVGRFDTQDVEAVLALEPDLVIAWGSGNGPQVVAQLRELNIPVYVDEPTTLEAIARSLQNFATLAGVDNSPAVEHYRRRLAQLNSQYRERPNLSVFYQVWYQPLQTINGEHIISDVIELCGGRNAFADAVARAPKINLEAVLARNPDVIVASGVDEHRPQWLTRWQDWPQLAAVKQQAIFHIPPDIIQRHTPRLLQGAAMMCDLLEQVRRQQAR